LFSFDFAVMVEEAPAQVVAVHDRWKWMMPLHSTTSEIRPTHFLPGFFVSYFFCLVGRSFFFSPTHKIQIFPFFSGTEV
jgi:hypothetical protein